ncbi:MepB family protein [Arthrobacter sp. AQ5-05]|uniref:MepB family protein n=1 Tax=Arthrobacter sp. AQ5-05 TaxID=2184581 RepID=UPI0015EB8EC8|nr:MepB family protein [Arthrobacter sp. AQ5-05]
MPPETFDPEEYVPELSRFLEAGVSPAAGRISAYAPDPNPEARAYAGCSFVMAGTDGVGTRTVFRSAKVTPTKAGLFAPLWTRDENGATRPYSLADDVGNFVIAASVPAGYGYFTFSAADLADRGILATGDLPGKRGFRLYTPWDTGLNKSASATWAWQRAFFTIVNG